VWGSNYIDVSIRRKKDERKRTYAFLSYGAMTEDLGEEV
jgi:hypothetical protein